MLRARSTMGCTAALICTLIGLLALPTGVNARAPGVKTLTDVGFTAAADHIEFSLRADGPIDPAAISARTDGRVLMIRVDGAQADRRWLDTEDPLVKRTLLHPSRKYAPAAVVRTRLTRTISGVMLENIRVRAEGGAVIVAVPRSTRVARRWAAGPPTIAAAPPVDAPASAVELVFAEPAPDAIVVPFAPPAAIAADRPAPPMLLDPPAAVTSTASAIATGPVDPADIPLDLGGETTALDAPPDVALSAGLAQAAGPGIGAFLMSLVFLCAVGLLMWRKMRGNRNTASGRPIIRPIGSHMLGPKQSLLLVDVAGEMVLLGTTDKGVQMLTKIEGRDEPTDAAEPAAAPAPAASFAERLGAAVSRFRSAAARLDDQPDDAAHDDRPTAAERAAERAVERRYYAREDEVREEQLREAGAREADDDALAHLAARVEDTPEIKRRRARTHFAPVEPAPARAPAPPPLDPSADLLRKIRNLQRA